MNVSLHVHMYVCTVCECQVMCVFNWKKETPEQTKRNIVIKEQQQQQNNI